MNLDLNLGPLGLTSAVIEPGSEPSLAESLDIGRLGQPLQIRIGQALRQGTRQRLRWRRLHLSLENVDSDGSGSGSGDGDGDGDGNDNPLGMSEGENVYDGGGSGTSQVGEGSVAVTEKSCEVLNTCENSVSLMDNGSVQEKESTEKISFFDCNICFDLAREPIVTCCGHLFCWSCIYQWLEINSIATECPVCKGEVTLKNVTPIYGCGNHTQKSEDDSVVKIPARPSGKRVESLRQTIQRTSSSFPMEEMIRRLGARYELTRDFTRDGDTESTTRAASRLNRIMAIGALHRQHAQRHQPSPSVSPENVVDLTQDIPVVVPNRLPNLTYRTRESHRSSPVFESYLQRSPSVRNEEMQSYLVEDRDSFSSIGAVIHGESQTVDITVEIDSLGGPLSTSSSIRRLDASRGSDMDSGDSRARRRRLD